MRVGDDVAQRALARRRGAVRVMSAEIEPTTRLASGATAVRYLSAMALAAGSTVAGLRTNTPGAALLPGAVRVPDAVLDDEVAGRRPTTIFLVFLSSVMPMSVSTVPLRPGAGHDGRWRRTSSAARSCRPGACGR